MDNKLKSKKELEMVGRKNENIEQETNDYNAWSYDFSDAKTPSSMMYGGKANAGKVLTCNGDGYIVLLPAQGGEGGYEPDDETIGLDTDLKLYVKDYASKTYVDGLDDSIRQWVEDTFCLESFAVELDERLEVVEEDLTEINPIVARALLTPVATPTSKELVGVNTNKEQIRITLGSGLTLSDSNVLSATGGGGDAEPVYVITGTATITDPTSLVDIPINITSTNIYNELATFYNLNNRLPRIIMKLSLSYEETIISNIFIDLIANSVEQNEFSLAGSSNDLSSSGISVSYVDISMKSTEQTGSLTATPLQTKLTADSEFSARKINIGRYFVTETVMEALNHLLSGAVLLDTNQDISGTKTFTSSFGVKVSDTPNLTTNYKNGSVEVAHTSTGNTDYFNFPNKDGGNYTLATTDDLPSTTKSYLHCIEVLDDNNNINFYLRFINHSNTTYTTWSQVVNETKKMWGWGRTNQQASTYHRYDITAMGDNGTVLFIDEENNTYDLEEVKVSSLTDRGCVEL